MMVSESTLENPTCMGGLLLVVFVSLALCSHKRQRPQKEKDCKDDLSLSPCDRSCPICLEQMPHTEATELKTNRVDDLKGAKDLCRLPCGHVFHHTCLSRWFKVSASCPYRCSEAIEPCDSGNVGNAGNVGSASHGSRGRGRQRRREETDASDAWCFVTSAERCRELRQLQQY